MSLIGKKELEEIKGRGLASLYPEKTKIAVGMSTCGRASGAEEVIEAIQSTADSLGLDIIVTSTGCMGLCQKEPLVDLVRPGWPRVVYQQMDAKRAQEIVKALAEDKVLHAVLLPFDDAPRLQGGHLAEGQQRVVAAALLLTRRRGPAFELSGRRRGRPRFALVTSPTFQGRDIAHRVTEQLVVVHTFTSMLGSEAERVPGIGRLSAA